MNTEKIARGWALIAEGAMELSLAYESIEPAAARAAVPDSVPTAPVDRAAGAPPSAALTLKPQVDAGLGICPIHGKRWTVKPAGVSKAGKPYSAFYKCAERDENGYCNEKPQRIWQDTHPIPEGAAA